MIKDNYGLERILKDIYTELRKNPLHSAIFWGPNINKNH